MGVHSVEPAAPSVGRQRPQRTAARTLRMLVLAGLGGFGGAPSQAASRARVLKSAILTEQRGESTLAVDAGGAVWLGTKRLEEVARIGGTVLGGVVRDGVGVVWSGRREGPQWLGQIMRVHGDQPPVVQSLGTPPLDVRIDEDGVVWVLQPGSVLRVDPRGAASRTLPVDRPTWTEDGALAINFGSARLALDPTTGCPLLPPVDRWPFSDALLLGRMDASRCTTGTPLPSTLAVAAGWELEQARLAAWRTGDILRTWALGMPESDPEDTEAPGRWEGHKPKVVMVNRSIVADVGAPLAVVLQPLPADGPEAWMGDPGAPACHGGVILVASDAAQLAAWDLRLRQLKRSRTPCVEGLRLVSQPSLQVAPTAGATVVYTDADGMLVGERSGRPSTVLIRDDLVKLAGAADPLHAVASAPELTPGWKRTPGPGSDMLIDVDGSIVLGLGHRLLRNSSKGHRPEEIALPGPVQSIRLTERSSYEIVVAGQRAEAVFEGGHLGAGKGLVTWQTEGPLDSVGSPPPPGAPLVGWMISGRFVQPPGGIGPVDVGAQVRSIVTWTGGAVVQTDRGAVGLWADGEPAWRVPDAVDVAVVDELIVASLPWGAAGYRAPLRRLEPEPSPEAEEEPEGGSGQDRPQGGGNRGGGGQGGGGPQGGGQGGGGGGPQGGGGQGGGGGGPQGGGGQGGGGGGPQGGGGQGGGGQGGGGHGGGGLGGGGQGGGGQGGGGQGGGGQGGGGQGGGGGGPQGGGGQGGGGQGGGGQGGGGQGGGGQGGGGQGGGGQGGGGQGGGGQGGG